MVAKILAKVLHFDISLRAEATLADMFYTILRDSGALRRAVSRLLRDYRMLDPESTKYKANGWEMRLKDLCENLISSTRGSNRDELYMKHLSVKGRHVRGMPSHIFSMNAIISG
jgi:hypothetical protein